MIANVVLIESCQAWDFNEVKLTIAEIELFVQEYISLRRSIKIITRGSKIVSS